MLSGRQLSMEDYFKMVRRRVWLVIIPVVLGPLIALVIAKKLSPKYTSVSQILIDEPKVPTSFVPSVENNNLISRLANMEEQILSRTSLEPLIERYGLYKADVSKVPMEELVARMIAAIDIKTVRFANQPGADDSSSKNQVPGFRVSFTADTPQLAQSICSEITSMFINANLREQTNRAQGTADFIAVELQQAKQQLDEQDAKLASFKRAYFGSLPDQEQSTIQLLGTLSTQLNSLTEAMSGFEQQRTYTESLLTQQVEAWKAVQTEGGGSPETLQDQLSILETRLTDLRNQFTDSYPDVIKTEGDIKALEERIAKQNAADRNSQAKKTNQRANPALEPPQISQLRAQLQAEDDAIKNNQAQQTRLRQAIAGYEGKLKMTPAVEQQYKDLTRNYQTTLDNYNNLLKKEDVSQMATNLETRQEGEQFIVLDPADRPQKPSFPNYSRFFGGGLLAGLILGFGLVLALEMQDKALRDEKDIEFFMGVPTLALIPEIENGHKKGLLTVWRGRIKGGAVKALGN